MDGANRCKQHRMKGASLTNPLVTARRAPIKYLSTQEIQALFAVIRDVRDRAIFRVIYHRGLRASEVGRLNLQHYSTKINQLYVNRLQGSYGGLYPVVNAEKEALRAWLRKRRRAPGPLFLSRNHRAISRWALDDLMKKYCALAGIPKSKAHVQALKHSCRAHLLMREGNIMLVKDHLGQANPLNTPLYAPALTRGRDQLARRQKNWS